MIGGLFSLAAGLGAFLIFVVQPLAAKLLLPAFGGSYLVFSAATVFFQAALFGGYGIAHLLFGEQVTPPRQLLYLVLLGAVALGAAPTPGQIAGAESTAHHLVIAIVAVLASAIGPFVIALASGSVVLQRWWQTSPDTDGSLPWFVYAASNAGALAGLLAYPLLLEPRWPAATLLRGWHQGVMLWVIAMVICLPRHPLPELRWPAADTPDPADAEGVASDRAATPHGTDTTQGDGATPAPDESDHPEPRMRGWLLPTMAGSALCTAMVQVMTLDLTSVPGLWMVPLAVYLTTWIAAFRPNPPLLELASRRLPEWFALGLSLGLITQLGFTPAISVRLLLQLAVLAMLALVAHTIAAAHAPIRPERLTRYYLWLAAGGWLGSAVMAWVVPLVTATTAEWPLALALAAIAIWPERWWWPASPDPTLALRLGFLGLLLGGGVLPGNWGMPITGPLLVAAVAGFVIYMFIALREAANLQRNRALTVVAVAVGCLLLDRYGTAGDLRHLSRNHYGIYRVFDQGTWRLLQMGSTIHGHESLDPARAGQPFFYFHPSNPIGALLRQDPPTWRRAAVVGLGAGTLAAYAGAGQELDFYELDPAAVSIARRWFSYLGSSSAIIRCQTGDGRLGLRRAATGTYDLIVLDAFSSDAIPAHLLTREAAREYGRALAADGLLVFHITNRHLDLAGMLHSIAADLRLECRLAEDQEREGEGLAPTRWVAMGSAAGIARHLDRVAWWQRARPSLRLTPAWTDEHSSIWPVLRFFAGDGDRPDGATPDRPIEEGAPAPATATATIPPTNPDPH